MLFLTVEDYVMTFALISDHLLHFLLSEKEQQTPLYLFEKMSYVLPEQEKASLMLDMASWTENSFVIRKILVEVNEESLPTYWNVMKAFSAQTFGCMPEQIEVIDLQSAQRYIHIPKKNESLLMIEDKLPCLTCPAANTCVED